MKVLDMEVYDAILGYDWLSAHSPMTCHWDTKTLEFEDKGIKVTLHGHTTQQPKLQQVSMPTLAKWVKGNAVWALALVDTPSSSTPPPPPPPKHPT